MVVTPVATQNPGQSSYGIENEGRSAVGEKASCNFSENEEPAAAREAMPDVRAVSGKVVTNMHDLVPDERNGVSDADAAANEVATDVTTTVTTALSKLQRCHSIDPHAFIALDAPAVEPCSACGKTPSQYRERRGGGRRLRTRCYSAAVRREQRAAWHGGTCTSARSATAASCAGRPRAATFRRPREPCAGVSRRFGNRAERETRNPPVFSAGKRCFPHSLPLNWRKK